MEDNKDITIYDIAKKLNLATSTISRALKDHHTISAKTIKKVKEACAELGYRPNSLAAGLRSNKTQTIGVLVPTIDQPFLSSLISGIETTAKKSGYNILITQSGDSYQEEINMTQALYASRISGIICSLGMETRDTAHFMPFIDAKIPLVFVDRVPNDIDTYRVIIDNYAAGYKATKHLIDQGCKRVAHFYAGGEFGTLFSERKRGYLDALKAHNLPIEEDLIIKLELLVFAEGIKATNKLLDMNNPPDGIFSSVDITAISAIQCAKKRGVKIPEELAIIGFNDDPISSIIDPGLSTISHPAFKMGQISAEKILNHLLSPKKDNIKEVTYLNTEVIIRESTKRN
nr:LacI family DNA-binding transcriptional regulator [uncultured Flavobacterium sp.]